MRAFGQRYVIVQLLYCQASIGFQLRIPLVPEINLGKVRKIFRKIPFFHKCMKHVKQLNCILYPSPAFHRAHRRALSCLSVPEVWLWAAPCVGKQPCLLKVWWIQVLWTEKGIPNQRMKALIQHTCVMKVFVRSARIHIKPAGGDEGSLLFFGQWTKNSA